MLRIFALGSFGLVSGAVVGGLLSAFYLTYKFGLNLNKTDPFLVLSYPPTVARLQIAEFQIAYGLIAGFAILAAILALVWFYMDQLSIYGEAHFQSYSEIKKNGFFEEMGRGLVYGRYRKPPSAKGNRPIRIKGKLAKELKSTGAIISAVSADYPNTLLIAPTGAGKGVGFMIPSLFAFQGSTVTLDVKGEIYKETARYRQNKLGDTVLRFAPFDFANPSHQYNPLHRVAQFADADQRHTELEKIANYFLQIDSSGNATSFVGGAKELFVAAATLAIERKVVTFGEVYRIIYGTGQGKDATLDVATRLANAVEEAVNPFAKATFAYYANLDSRVRDSYTSVLKAAGLGQWSNPRVEKMTRHNDIDFTTIQAKPQSIYLVVQSDDIEMLSSLIRLFFTELIAHVRSRVPKPSTDPWPVMISLDEFDQLGHMPIFVEAMKQTRGHNARVNIITQSVPGLMSIYSRNEFKSIEASCGVKLYISANEGDTAEEIESALGTRTMRAVSKSKNRNVLSKDSGSISVHSEERPLLDKSEIRRLSDDKIIIIPQRQHPMLADKISYFKDPYFAPLWKSQEGPYPEAPKGREERDKLEERVRQLETKGAHSLVETIETPDSDGQENKGMNDNQNVQTMVLSAASAVYQEHSVEFPQRTEKGDAFGKPLYSVIYSPDDLLIGERNAVQLSNHAKDVDIAPPFSEEALESALLRHSDDEE